MLQGYPAVQRSQQALGKLYREGKEVRRQLFEIHSAAHKVPQVSVRSGEHQRQSGELALKLLSVPLKHDVGKSLIGI